jgi:hypothetical protein
MLNVYFFQPQYAVEIRNEKNYWLPYSIGCLWSYCQQFQDVKDNFALQDIVFKREPHQEVIARLDNPKIAAFSCYQWNRNYNLRLAESIKKYFPNCKIIFGGPEVTADFTLFEFIDSVIFSEGEYSMLDILRRVLANDSIPETYAKQRVDGDNLPSPYSTGVFDNLIKNNPGVKWATTLETNRGCPFSCTFCDWGGLTYSKVKKLPLHRVEQDLDWIARNPIGYIFCADANFGIFKERDLEIARMVKETGQRNPGLDVFNATFNKNNNEWSFKILELLGDLNKGFTVSVQSLHQPTLKAIKRDNLGINDLKNIFKLSEQHGVNAYTELILGLPLETRETFVNGLTELLELGQHNQIEVWFTDLLINSELATGMSKINYGIKTVSTKNYLALLNQNDNNEFDEDIELVCATNTMPTEDMIDSYLYAWVIVNVHLQGYSQLISKYCRYKYNISFRSFYDQLLKLIKTDEETGKIYNKVKTIVTGLLNTGVLPDGVTAHNLVFLEGASLYNIKDSLFDLISKLIDSIAVDGNHNGIKQLQKSFIFDHGAVYPINVDCDFDFDKLECADTSYSISSKVVFELKEFSDSYYSLRRKGLIKNKIEKRIIL